VLSAAETSVAESLLAEAWGKAVAVRSAETIWGRSHIVRLRLADAGGSVVLKRRRSENFGGRVRGFAAELATLEFLNAEETAVAPRLIGASADLLLMEDLGPGSSLAHALLARDCAEADLAAYARALATMHAWSMGRAASFSSVRARRAPSVPTGPEWPDRVAESKQPLLEVAVRLGLSVEGAAAEIDSLDGLHRARARRPVPGQHAHRRRPLPDLRLRDRGVGAARAGRLLPAGTVPELLVLRIAARPSGRPGAPGVPRQDEQRWR
jgi:hypothetical protein